VIVIPPSLAADSPRYFSDLLYRETVDYQLQVERLEFISFLTMPPLFQLTARLNHPDLAAAYAGCYAYDEQTLGLVAEPLVHSTTAVIQYLFGAPHPVERTSLTDVTTPEVVSLTFSTDRKQLPDASDAVVQLSLTDADDDGSNYAVKVLHSSHKISAMRTERPLTAWLCSHLCDYFSAPPDVFYCSLQQA
jgi:hypothetical protein